MDRLMKRWSRYVLAVLLLAVAWPAMAEKKLDVLTRSGGGPFTEGELNLLPEFCRDIQGTVGYSGPRGNYWRSLIGNDLQHMHHYCRGLRFANYAVIGTVSPTDRKFLWELAIGEYDYMLRNCRRGMLLIPEFHLRKGEAFLHLGQLPEAEDALKSARSIKPDYWQAYTPWADKLVELKLYDRARSLLEEGLKYSPGQAELSTRLERLKQGKAPE